MFPGTALEFIWGFKFDHCYPYSFGLPVVLCNFLVKFSQAAVVIVSICVRFSRSPVSCKVCVLACTLYHTAKLIQQGDSACVSFSKVSSCSPLWESLAVKLILLSHTPVSVPHLSVQPRGLSCSPCTPGFSAFLLLSDFKGLLAACSHRD